MLWNSNVQGEDTVGDISGSRSLFQNMPSGAAHAAGNLVNLFDETLDGQPHREGDKAPASNVEEELNQAMKRINVLEKQIKNIGLKSPKKYPDVMFLNYKDRKRIMVSFCKQMISYIVTSHKQL